MRTALAILLTCLLAGCLESEAVMPGGDLRAGVEAHLSAYLARDIEAALAHEHDPWVDLGGGSCDAPRTRSDATTSIERASAKNDTAPEPSPRDTSCDPANVTHEEWRAFMADAFASEEYRAATEGRAVRDLFEMDSMTEEDAAAYLARIELRTAFEPIEGDVAVRVPPRGGSLFFDGWSRIYREGDGAWLSVAGD